MFIIEYATVEISTFNEVIPVKYAQLNMLIRLGREFGHEQIRGAGFSDTEHAICTFLCFHDQVSQDRVANALMQDKTTVAKALRTLERRGLVDRAQNEHNRRENIIRLTESGRASVHASVDLYDAWLTDICSCLSEEESRNLESYFNKLVDCAIQRRDIKKDKSERKR